MSALFIIGLLALADEVIKNRSNKENMKYTIFRITPDGYIKDVSYKPFDSYLKAENVVKSLKKDYPNRRYIIQQIY